METAKIVCNYIHIPRILPLPSLIISLKLIKFSSAPPELTQPKKTYVPFLFFVLRKCKEVLSIRTQRFGIPFLRKPVWCHRNDDVIGFVQKRTKIYFLTPILKFLSYTSLPSLASNLFLMRLMMFKGTERSFRSPPVASLFIELFFYYHVFFVFICAT